MPLEDRDDLLAAEALALAILAFGQLLEVSEPVLNHGLNVVALEITQRLFAQT